VAQQFDEEVAFVEPLHKRDSCLANEINQRGNQQDCMGYNFAGLLRSSDHRCWTVIVDVWGANLSLAPAAETPGPHIAAAVDTPDRCLEDRVGKSAWLRMLLGLVGNVQK